MKHLYFDAAIAGCGVAGLYTALHLPSDKKILLLSKGSLSTCDSMLAQGGICVLRDDDDYDSYFEDTMRAGHYENRRESVDIMIRSSREVIRELIGYGVKFQKKKSRTGRKGKDFLEDYTFTREGAHSECRILFHEDITGKEITGKLLEAVRKLPNITILEHTVMTDIIEDTAENNETQTGTCPATL